MNNNIKQKNNFGKYTKLAWSIYNEIIKASVLFWFSKTSRITSLYGGNQNGFVDDLQQAPPLSLKFKNVKFKQGRNNEKERKKI